MANLQATLNEMGRRTSDEMCPMTIAAGKPGKCLGHGCAWWNPHYQGCAIGTAYLTQDHIGHMIGRVSDQLYNLCSKEDH